MRLLQRFYPIFVGFFALGLASFVNGDEVSLPRLSDAQKSCLDGRLGLPGQGEPPTHEAMDEAFAACDVPKPDSPPPAERAPAGLQSDEQNSAQ